jgi:signal transduction histidine kinase
VSFAIVLDEDGASAGAMATARDITERFEQDRENRRKMTELEESLKELQESGS